MSVAYVSVAYVPVACVTATLMATGVADHPITHVIAHVFMFADAGVGPGYSAATVLVANAKAVECCCHFAWYCTVFAAAAAVGAGAATLFRADPGCVR